jgi:hypothetical protein
MERDNNIREWTSDMNYILIWQVFERNAYFESVDFDHLLDDILDTMHIKCAFDLISKYLWDDSVPNNCQPYFKDYPKLDGKELREYYNTLKNDIVENDLYLLPPMVTLPFGRRGQDITEEELEEACAYRDAMDVFEGDEHSVIRYKRKKHNKSMARFVHMYVEELIFKYKLKNHLEYVCEDFPTFERNRYLRDYEALMDYSNARIIKRQKDNALFVQEVSSYYKDHLY